MFTILGYNSEISVASGESFTCHVSAEHEQRYQARIVRIINGDCNPLGGGFSVAHVPTSIDGTYHGKRQRVDAGSYMVVRELIGVPATLTFSANIWPTLVGWRTPQVIAHYEGGFTLSLAGGALTLAVAAHTLSLPADIVLEREWLRVCVTIDGAAGRIVLRAVPLRRSPLPRPPAEASIAADCTLPAGGAFYLAGAPQPDGSVENHFNGKLEAPALIAGAATENPLSADIVAAWDFSRDMASTRAVDAGPLRQHGELVNLPARAMTGAGWTIDVHDWRDDPKHYAAIHFHHDDIYDAGWDAAFTVTVPADLRSGAYAVHLHAGENTEAATNEDYIPFFVRPPRARSPQRTRKKKLLWLAPTNSYLAYANDSQVLNDRGAEIGMGRLLVLQHADVYLHRHPELGASLYDKHADGSGVCYSSWLRPVLNLRPRYHSWLGSHGSALWQYNADTHILAWLEQQGVEFDVATDDDLHRDGMALLDGYRAVMTGTHPEYHSTAMYDAMQAYLDRGGRLIYMGGNGWYWRVAFPPDLPGVIEVRRAESGTRTWEAMPGESHHSFSGELGGLWRRIGRAPNQIAGVGFVAQGFDQSSYYRRQPDADNPRAGFIFDGVSEEKLGDFGLVGSGAAGVELDGFNKLLGSPAHALVLATSENHTQMTLLTPEEYLVTPVTIRGDETEKIRADMVFFETAHGGAVFSTGSIAWAGSLLWNGGGNNVSRITGNVLRRFLDPAPFAPPWETHA